MGRKRTRRGRLGVAAVTAVAAASLLAAPAKADVTVLADSPTVSNCFPFGMGFQEPGDPWHQMGYVYKNVPAFNLAPGKPISFDLGVANDEADIELDVELAAAASNGSDAPAGPYTKVVTNTQKAAAPRGNAVVGDYELAYLSRTQFSFPGGGLIIRFSNPSAAYQADTDCDQVLVGATSLDTSGFFVKRFYGDPDGLPPYAFDDTGDIGGFRVVEGPRVTCAGRVATIVGTTGADQLVGTTASDVIAALEGNDTVKAGKGKDVVCGGAGKDRLFGGAGKDRLLGQTGKDVLRGGKGKDKLKGGAGKDSERQ